MSTPNATIPAPDTTPASKPPVNGWGIAALILGIAALVLGIIPFVGYATWVLGVLAVVFGIIGVTRKLKKKGTSITGLIIGAVSILSSIIIAIAWTAALAAAVGGAADKAYHEGAGTHSVVYSVTGTGKALITYESLDASSNKTASHSETVTLPFTKTLSFTTKSSLDVNVFTVTGSATDSAASTKLACSVSIDGVSKATDDASGPGALVTCSGGN